ncbi:MAG: aspartate/glutamate racemase family protein [Pseudomonadota bacterium]
MIATGGKSLYGASVGILMLDAQFPRIPGDMGNAATWPFPVHYRIVRGATPDHVVRHRAEGMLGAFIDAGRSLAEDGADGISTNCGFLSLFQDELDAALDVPVMTSSLMQVAMVNAVLPQGRRAGVLTISGSTLTKEHLTKAGAPPDTPIGSTEDGSEFTRVILGDELHLDVKAARSDNIAAARALQAANPDLGAIVLECTNMCPYAADIRDAVGLPIFSIYDLLVWFQGGLRPRRHG